MLVVFCIHCDGNNIRAEVQSDMLGAQFLYCLAVLVRAGPCGVTVPQVQSVIEQKVGAVLLEGKLVTSTVFIVVCLRHVMHSINSNICVIYKCL